MQSTPTITRGTDIRATVCLIGATFCWGAVPVMLKYLARPEYIPDGFTTNAIRYPIAALFYLPWLVIGIRQGQLRSLWLTAMIPTVVNLIGQTLWAWAPYHLDAGASTNGMKGLDLGLLGIPSERALLELYAKSAHLEDVPNIDFYVAFSMFRLAAILAGVLRRGIEGNAADPRAIERGQTFRQFATSGWAIASNQPLLPKVD